MSAALAFWGNSSGPVIFYAEVEPLEDYSYELYDSPIDATSRTIVSDAFTAKPNNGTAPYTYLWEAVYNPSTILIQSSATPKTTFKKTLIRGASATGTFRCKITDAAAAVIYSPTISVMLEYVDTYS